MRPTRSKPKKRHRVSAAAVKRVVVDFPRSLLERTERAAAELDIDRSKLIRAAVERHLVELQRKKLEEELAEGYRLNAEFDRALAAEFASVDYESF